MTLPELLVGVTVMTVVLAASATFISAVAAGWKHSESQQAVDKAGSRSAANFQQMLGSSKSIMRVQNGGVAGEHSYVFYWKYDGLTGTPDGKAQAGEMAMIEYNPTDKTVWSYEPPTFGNMTVEQQTLATRETWANLRSDASAIAFRDSDLATPTPLVGPGSGEQRGTLVEQARFATFIPADGKPVVAYKFSVSRNGETKQVAGSTMVRSPMLPENIVNP
jgi:hypothetical protein